MNEKKKKISSIPAKKSPAKKTKRQSKKAPKKVVKEALKKRQEEHHDECSVCDKNEESSGKLIDSVEETNSDKKTRVPKKKIVSPDKMEIVKKYKEKVKCYEHDDTHS